MASKQRPSLEIAIIGGGVSGLTCAVALTKRGVNAHVYEARARHTTINFSRNYLILYRESSVKLEQELGWVSLPSVLVCHIDAYMHTSQARMS